MLTIMRAALMLSGAAFAQTEPQAQPQLPPQAQPQIPVHVAPSFDCAHAASVVDKEICAVAEFADLDARIATLYAQAQTIVSPRDAEALRADQKMWLRERDACGNVDVHACLHDQLNRREAFLRVVFASKQFTKP